jgi:anti-sigma B factor antagonist
MLTPSVPGREEWRPFQCDVDAEAAHVRVTPRGELDVATAPEVEQRLGEVRDSGADHVLLDLRQLSFMDSTGLRVVMRADAAARADGHTFEVVPGIPAVQRVLELAGVTGQLTFVKS